MSSCELRLRLRPDVLVSTSKNKIVYNFQHKELAVEDSSSELIGVLATVSDGSASVATVRKKLIDQGDLEGWLRLRSWLERITTLLVQTIELDGTGIARLVYLSPRSDTFRRPAPRRPLILSRFAYVRRVGSELALECPLGYARLLLDDPRTLEVIFQLGQPNAKEELAAKSHLPLEAVEYLISFLSDAQAVTIPRSDETGEEDNEAELAQWEFHDLLFHSRSRFGRQEGGYGGTYRFRGRFPAPLADKNAPQNLARPPILLPKPNVEHYVRHDPPFSAVLEQRRSVRSFGALPISHEALGEFLYRVAHITKSYQGYPGDHQLSLRPYPAGGAIHELEIYPVISECSGLDAAIYRYDAFRHSLIWVADPSDQMFALLQMARRTLEQDSQPQILLVITARFQRIQWKYESMAYALILKNLGVLYQTMYLVATAMQLAPCALGGGDSDLFASASGLKYYAEASVGEFVIGTTG